MKIKAEIHFYLNSGRKSNFNNGYMAQFLIRPDKMFNSFEVKYIDKESVAPGETVLGIIRFFIAPELVKDYLAVGKEFKIFEGMHVMGEGKILELLGD